MSLNHMLSRLIWFCIGPLIVLAGIFAVSGVITKQAEYNLEASNLAKSFTQEIDQYLQSRINALHMLAESSLADHASRWKDLYREAQGFQHGFGNHVVFADREMHMLFNTRAPFGAKLPDLPRPRGQAAAPMALATGKPTVGDVFWGPIAKEPLVAIVVPVYRSGKIPYLMLTIFETKRFQEHLDRLALPAGWSLTIFDSSQTLIARRAPADFNSAKDVDASGRFVVGSSVSPWSVVLEIPRHVYREPLIHTAIWFAIAILIAILVSVVGGKMTGRRLGKAVTSLADPPTPGTPLPDITEIATVRQLLDKSAEERQKAEAARRASEERYRLIAENTTDVIWIVDAASGCFTYMSPSVDRLSGYKAEEMIGRRLEHALTPESYQQVTEQLADRIAQFEAGDRSMLINIKEVGQPRKDGSIVSTEVVTTFITDDAGKAVMILGVTRDITERKQAEENLRRSEEKFRTLVEKANEAILIAQDGKFAYANPQLGHILGIPTEDLIGKPFVDYIHPDDKSIVLDRYKKRLAGEFVPDDYDFRVVNKAGETRWLHIYAQQIQWDDRPATLNLLLDLTEQKQTEEQLRKSQELEKSILSSVPHGIFGLEDRKIVFANDAIENVTGWKPEELIGKTTRIFFRNDREWQEFGAVVYGRMQNESVFSYESLTPFIKKNGREMYCRTSFSRIGEYPSSSNRVVATVEDITEAKRTEIALKASVTRFDQLAEQSRTFHWEVDRDGLYTFVSHIVMKVLGYQPDELVGKKHFYDLHPDEARDDFKKAALAVFERKETFRNLENPALSKDGRLVWLSTNGMPMLDDDGALQGYRGTDTDTTDRKLAEQENTLLQNQLLQAQKMESVGRLAGGIAHDFNNMLGVILGHTEMALDQTDLSHQLRTDLEQIRKAAQRSADLTGQLLAFARKQTVSPKVLDLNDIVEGMLKMLRRLIGEDIHLVWLPGRNLWPVRMDPSQIDQILANLCVNARDAITGVGNVTIQAGTEYLDEAFCANHTDCMPGDYVLLIVSDNGCGMDKETLDKLFEPFFTTKETGKGTGLGLATVYGIVKQNEGCIEVDSKPGQGTTFKIYLPRYIGKAEQIGTAEFPEHIGGGRETILLVEDESAILAMTKRMLERQGYHVLTATTPGEALHVAGEYAGEIQLLITDVVMPEMNGRDLAGKLLSCYPNLKRLFMSGYTADVIAHHGVLDAGVHFIQKPFSLAGLAAKVRDVLDND